jgi:hypothetical protein
LRLSLCRLLRRIFAPRQKTPFRLWRSLLLDKLQVEIERLETES